MKKKLYIATSWRNPRFESLKKQLEGLGFSVYDFKAEENAFHWRQIDPEWDKWTPTRLKEVLSTNSLAIKAFNADFAGLKECDMVILLLPCGKSAHLEAGWAIGNRKPVLIYNETDNDPELMHLMVDVDNIFTDEREFLFRLGQMSVED